MKQHQETLNPQQHEAVKHLSSPLLVLAGAGSGKTRVITEKMVYLIKTCGIDPRRIAAVTFTNKAAREMKERVASRLPEARGLMVSTFHTLGLQMIRKEHKAIGYKSSFTILDNHDTLSFLKELAKEHAHDQLSPEAVANQISRWKSLLLSPPQALKGAEDEMSQKQAMLYAHYDKYLRACHACDFDDLIALPVQLFSSHPECLERWQQRIYYLLVDEYQDTNAAQYQLMKLLVKGQERLTVVGDDDQSVYAWRGARPENITLLQDDFPRLKVVKLEQNYRSSGRILKVANQLISKNPHVFEKRLWSQLGFGDPIQVLQCQSAEDEAERVVDRLLHHKFTWSGQFRDYAILYRGNYQARPFEQVLRAQRIPYQLSGGTSFFARSEIKDLMAYLRLLVNQDDNNAFLRIVNTPRREIGPVTVAKLAEYATEQNINYIDAALSLGLAHRLPPHSYQRLYQFAQWVVMLGDRALRGDAVAVVEDLLRDIDYRQWLEDEASDPKTAENRWENVQELRTWITRLRDESEGEDPHLPELVARLSLYDILDRNEDDNRQGDSVQLMTLHAAKGLEFNHVFLVGMEENLLPHRVSIEEDNIEEERRLTYVGITRAQRTLTLSLATERKRYKEAARCQPSRFLDEMPQEDLEWQGTRLQSGIVQDKQQVTRNLAQLRQMIKRPH